MKIFIYECNYEYLTVIKEKKSIFQYFYTNIEIAEKKKKYFY